VRIRHIRKGSHADLDDRAAASHRREARNGLHRTNRVTPAHPAGRQRGSSPHFASGSNANHQEETGMTTREHQLADLYVEMINTHNPDLEDRFLAEDYVNHEALFSAEGREANQQFWAGFFTGLPDVKVTMEDLVISGDRVVGRFTYRGTHTGDLSGVPATGKPVEMRSIDIWRVQDGMFAEHWDEINAMQMFQQIGALPPLGGLQARA
jgi:steroid delta-isomerase-like uncharacterized protein